MIYELYVNLNERGHVYCDVRDESEKTIWEISGTWDDVVNEDGSDDFDPTNCRKVYDHLLELNLINKGDNLTSA